MIITILSTVFALGILIFIHEFGHFIAAKAFGMRVERFSMGYPPRLAGKKIGDTDYCISGIPFGGYVKITGMVDESLDTKSLEGPPKPYEFRAKPWYQRMIVVFAGAGMNLLFGLIFFVILAWTTGEFVNESRIGTLIPNQPAEAAGFQEGDQILSVNDVPVSTWEELTREIRENTITPLEFEVERSSETFILQVTPEIQTVHDQNGEPVEISMIGISPMYKRTSFPNAVIQGSQAAYGISKLILESLWKLISGQESVKSLGGPVAIARMAGESARAGFGVLLSFTALLSINLALLNLLPLPVLDGGHLLILSIEGIVRREIPTKAKLVVQQVGMALILGLMLFVIYNDIVRVVADKG